MPRIAAREREARVEERQGELVEAALGLFSERGYDATSVAAIARRAGVSKGAFYLYFPSKLELLEEIFRRHSLSLPLEKLVGELARAPLEQVIPQLVRTVWSHLLERKHLIVVLLREMPTHLELARHFMERLVLPTNRLFASYLEARLGPERARSLNLLVAGRGLIGMVLVMFVTQEILGGRELASLSEDEITSSISRLFLNGVLEEPC